MKKIIIVLCLLLVAALPAPVSSFYADGKQALVSGQTTTITSFNTKQEGFYRLTGDTFITSYAGLAKLSGRCLLKRAPEVLVIYITVDGVQNTLTADAGESVTISYTFPAGNVVLSAYTESQYGVNGLNCNLLFEKVK